MRRASTRPRCAPSRWSSGGRRPRSSARACNGGDRALRWYSPAGIELTLCGHGTVAAAHVLAARGAAPRGRLVFEAPRHRLAITMEGAAPAATAWFEPDCPSWKPESGDLSPFLAMLGLPAGAVAVVGAARADVGGGPPDPGGDARRAPGAGARPRPARTAREGPRGPRDRPDGARDPRAGRPHSQPRSSSRTSGSRRTSRPDPRMPPSASGSGRPAVSPPPTAWRGSGESREISRAGRGGSPSRSTAPPAARPVSASAGRGSS